MSKPLGVGVIGLGRRWQRRYKPALLALRQMFRIQVVYDAIQQQATREAGSLGCEAAPGINTVLERDDVEALLLLDPQWFRLWPIEQACRFGKPVYCGVSLECDDAAADALVSLVHDRQLSVMAEMRPRFAPAVVRLREVLATELGPPRLVVCECRSAAAAAWCGAGGLDTPLLGPGGIALVDCCTSLLDGDPVAVRADRVAGAGVGSVLFDYGGDRAGHLFHCHAPGLRSSVRVRIVTDSGEARAQLPDRLGWTDQKGVYRHVLRRPRTLTQILLERFYESVRIGQAPVPNLEDAYRALRLLRGAAQSHSDRQLAAAE
jgi:predicted dehydrogenase